MHTNRPNNIYEYDFNLLHGRDYADQTSASVESIEWKYKIYDQYIVKDIDIFSEFLKNKNNFMYFLFRIKALRMMPYAVVTYIVKEVMEPYYKSGKLVCEKLCTFDKNMFHQSLLTYYSYEARDWKIYYDSYNMAYDKYMDEDDENDLFFDLEIENEAMQLYEQKIIEKYVLPLVQKLYPLENNLSSICKFDEERVFKNFYADITRNSFEHGIEKFKLSSESLLTMLKNDQLRKDFLVYSQEAIDNVKQLQNILVGGENNIFNNKNYEHEGKAKWIPLLNRSSIACNEIELHACSLVKALQQYILIYSMKKTIETNNRANNIFGKNFEHVSEFSPILNYIQQVMQLDKPQFNYIFLKLLIVCCKASDSEIKFLLRLFEGLKKSTFEKHQAALPVIKQMSCPILDILYQS